MAAQSGFFSSCFNLSKAIIGSGIIALPFAAKTLGYGTFIVFLLISGFLCYYIQKLLLEICKINQSNTLEDISKITFNKKFGWPTFGARLVGTSICLQTIASACSKGVIIKTQIPEVIKYVLNFVDSSIETDTCRSPESWYFNGNILLGIVFLFVLFPMMCLSSKNLDFLKHTSLLGVTSMTVTILVIVYYSFSISCQNLLDQRDLLSNFTSQKFTSEQGQDICYYEPNPKILQDWRKFKETIISSSSNLTCQPKFDNLVSSNQGHDDFLRDPNLAIKIIFFACSTCTFLQFFDNLKKSSNNEHSNATTGSEPTEKMTKIMKTTLSFVILLYSACGLSGYFTWIELTTSDILLAYSVGLLKVGLFFIFLARSLMTISLIFSLPLLGYANQRAFLSFITGESNSLDGQFSTEKYKKKYRVLYIACLLILEYYMIVRAQMLSSVLKYSTSLTIFNCLIIPALLWMLTFVNKDKFCVKPNLKETDENQQLKEENYNCRTGIDENQNQNFWGNFAICALLLAIGAYFMVDFVHGTILSYQK